MTGFDFMKMDMDRKERIVKRNSFISIT